MGKRDILKDYLDQRVPKRGQYKGRIGGEYGHIFHDVAYYGLYGKKTHNPYLVRLTEAWTDMFGNKPRLHYRINPVNKDTLDIEDLIEEEFRTMEYVKEWLEEN